MGARQADAGGRLNIRLLTTKGGAVARAAPRPRGRRALVAVVVLCFLASSTAHAACSGLTVKERWARAEVVIDARALESATPTGVQRFRVIRYLKGHGPAIVRVNTGVVVQADGSGSAGGESLFVRRGQRWRIFAQGSPRRTLRSSVCDGSRRL